MHRMSLGGNGVGRSVLFVGDGGLSDHLVSTLAERGVRLDQEIFSAPPSLGRLGRHLRYVRAAFHAWRKGNGYDALFFWQQYIALYYCFLTLAAGRGRGFMVFYILYRRERSPLVDSLKRMVFGVLLGSKRLRCAVFASEDDPLYAQVPEHKRAHVWYMEPVRVTARDGDRPKGDAIFSGGMSNRDFTVIRQLALRNPDVSFRLACTRQAAARLGEIPGNMVLLHDCYGRCFVDEMSRARAFIIPLGDGQVVSGQITLLTALEAGTCVFMTRNGFLDRWLPGPGAEDFVHQFGTIEELEACLLSLDRDEAQRLGRAAADYAERWVRPQVMFEALADLIVQTHLRSRDPCRDHGGVASGPRAQDMSRSLASMIWFGSLN